MKSAADLRGAEVASQKPRIWREPHPWAGLRQVASGRVVAPGARVGASAARESPRRT